MKLLDAAEDAAEWLRVWQQTGRQPYAHPAYGSLLSAPGERPVAVVLEEPDGIAILPLLMRPVPGVPGRWDAASPYGYGGPFTSGTLDHERVLSQFSEWATGAGLCSLFLRHSLDFEVDAGIRGPGLEVRELFDNVVVDLRRTSDQIWMGYEHKVRKNVNKALRAGCTATRSPGLQDLDGFLDVYSETMRRRGAAAWYHFDRSFFARIAEELDACSSVFSVCDADGHIVSVELVLESDDYLYSFLGGTRAEAFAFSPNDLLKHEVIRHGQSTGRVGFVLGGGYQPGDGIFRYKRSFDPGGVRPFRVARVIGDRTLYEALVDHRKQTGGDSESDFFPAYRAPVPEPVET